MRWVRVTAVITGLVASLTSAATSWSVGSRGFEQRPISAIAPQLGKASPEFLIAHGGGYLMVDRGGAGRAPESWYSRDGHTWERGNLADMTSPSDVQIHHVIRQGRGVFAAGLAVENSGARRHMAWVTTDGRTWQPGTPLSQDGPGTSLAPSFTSHRGVAVAIAHGPHLWVGEAGRPWRRADLTLPEGCSPYAAVPADTPLGILLLADCPGGPESRMVPGSVLLVDDDGIAREISRGLPLILVDAVAVSGSTILIAGLRQTSQSHPVLGSTEPESGDMGPEVETVLHRSEDGGHTWLPAQRLPTPAHLLPGQVEELVTAAGNVVVAAGQAFDLNNGVQVPMVWSSSDGGAFWQEHELPAFGEHQVIGPAAVSGRTVVIVAKDGFDYPAVLSGLIRERPVRR